MHGDLSTRMHDRRRIAEQRRSSRVGGGYGGWLGRAARRLQLERRLNQVAQIFQPDRLGKVIERARLERRNRILGTAIGGYYPHPYWRVVFPDIPQDFQPLALRQPPVGQAETIRTRP